MQKRPRRALIFALACGLGLQASVKPHPPQGFVQSFAWNLGQKGFGGISAIETDPTGRDVTALTDHGRLFETRLERDPSGQILQIHFDNSIDLRVDPLRRWDSEGLAQLPQGRIVLSTEGPSATFIIDPKLADPQIMPREPSWSRHPKNAGLESIAADAQGQIYTTAEAPSYSPHHPYGAFPLFRFGTDGWTHLGPLPATKGYRIVGMDFGPDGHLYILERRVNLFLKFSSAIRRVELLPQGGIRESLLLTTPLGAHGNLEGLAIYENTKGQLIALLAADDNFHFLFPSEIIEYRLPD